MRWVEPSPSGRLEANDPKATRRPLEENHGVWLPSSPTSPSEVRLTSSVLAVSVSRAYTCTVVPSPCGRLSALEVNAATLPSPEIAVESVPFAAGSPLPALLTSLVFGPAATAGIASTTASSPDAAAAAARRGVIGLPARITAIVSRAPGGVNRRASPPTAARAGPSSGPALVLCVLVLGASG